MTDFFPVPQGARESPNLILIFVGVLVFAFGFCRLYELSYNDEEQDMPQTIRFGFLAALMTVISTSIIRFGDSADWSLMHCLVDAIFWTVVSIVLAIVALKILNPGSRTLGGGHDTGGEN